MVITKSQNALSNCRTIYQSGIKEDPRVYAEWGWADCEEKQRLVSPKMYELVFNSMFTFLDGVCCTGSCTNTEKDLPMQNFLLSIYFIGPFSVVSVQPVRSWLLMSHGVVCSFVSSRIHVLHQVIAGVIMTDEKGPDRRAAIRVLSFGENFQVLLIVDSVHIIVESQQYDLWSVGGFQSSGRLEVVTAAAVRETAFRFITRSCWAEPCNGSSKWHSK